MVDLPVAQTMVDLPVAQTITALGTMIAAAIGGLVGHWLSRNKYKKERTWEKRTETLSVIIHSLTSSIDFFLRAKSYYDENEERAINYPAARTKLDEANDYLLKANHAYISNLLFLTPEFIDKFDALEKDFRSTSEKISPTEEIAAAIEILEKHLGIISAQARKDAR